MKHFAAYLSLALILTSCGGSGSGSDSTPTDTTETNEDFTDTPSVDPDPTPDPVEEGDEVSTKDDRLVIATSDDFSGYALYVREDINSSCDTSCMSGRVPLTLYDGTASGYIRLAGVSDSTGATHITYNGKTLYRFEGDTSSATTNGINNGWVLANIFTIVGSCTLDTRQKALLELHNFARAESRSCGGEMLPAVGDLRWDCQLADAARTHSADMATNDFFSHEGSDGSNLVTRATAAGYINYRNLGENIYAGTNSTADDAVNGWLDSPGHCVNMMNADFEDMGGDVVENADLLLHRFWTVDFGRLF